MNRYDDLGLPGRQSILCALPDVNDSVAWWRALGPLTDLCGGTPSLDVDTVDFMRDRSVEWHVIHRSLCVMMSRPFLPDHAKLLQMASTMDLPTWIDYDDNYWDIPESNGAYATFDERACAVLSKAAEDASVITVSTETMREVIVQKVNPDTEIVVVPNAFPDSYQWPTVERKKVVLYRGGFKTHGSDLLSVADDLREAMRSHRDWTFVFCGGHPILFDEPNMRWLPPISVPNFHTWLRACGASVMVNPLVFSAFNACKSNIAWMEGTLAGAAVLAPALPQYNEIGCEMYAQGKFGERLNEVLDMSDADRAARVAASQRTIDTNYRLSVTNQVRSKIVKAIVDLR